MRVGVCCASEGPPDLLWRAHQMTIRPSLISAVLVLLLAPSLLVSCGDGCTTCPTDLGDWPVASPSSQGLNPALLDDLTDELTAGTLGLVSSVVIIRNGQLVYDEYFMGMSLGQLQRVFRFLLNPGKERAAHRSVTFSTFPP